MENKKDGFTLIELLVVIAIIGILSSIVFSSLGVARGKASDAKIKTNLSNIRNDAEIYYSDYGNYGAAVAGTEAVGVSIGLGCATNMFADSRLTADTLLVNYPSYSNAGKCTSTGSDYAVSAKLNSAGTYWCIDSTGISKQTGALQADNAVTCP